MTQSVEYRVIKTIAKIKNISTSDIQLHQSISELCDSSIDLVSLFFDLEDEFNINIPDTAKKLNTIQEMVSDIETLLQQNQMNDVASV